MEVENQEMAKQIDIKRAEVTKSRAEVDSYSRDLEMVNMLSSFP